MSAKIIRFIQGDDLTVTFTVRSKGSKTVVDLTTLRNAQIGLKKKSCKSFALGPQNIGDANGPTVASPATGGQITFTFRHEDTIKLSDSSCKEWRGVGALKLYFAGDIRNTVVKFDVVVTPAIIVD